MKRVRYIAVWENDEKVHVRNLDVYGKVNLLLEEIRTRVWEKIIDLTAQSKGQWRKLVYLEMNLNVSNK
jgi:hypothetical protein